MSYWIKVGPKPVWLASYEKRETDIGKMSCDHSSRDWSKLSTAKESQRLLGTNRNLEEARKHPPLEQREREERKGGDW